MTTQIGFWLQLANSPATMRNKKVTAEDQAVWDHVRASVRPLRPSLSARIKTHFKDEMAKKHPQPHHRFQASSLITPKQTSKTKITLKTPLANAKIDGMQRSTRRAITKGRIEPTTRIDLHGDRLENAHARFLSFLHNSAALGHRIVLVITGKGGHQRQSDFGTEISGVIRRNFPHWMQSRDVSILVSHYCPAHIKHGGEGAFYVFIRARAQSQ